MQNIAKCRKCRGVIQSFHRYDYVSCSCGEIAISGGLDTYEVYANSFDNVIRIDDLGNEITVKVTEKVIEIADEEVKKEPTREEKLEMLDNMIKSFENLPQHALLTPATQADLYSVLLLFSSILRSS